MNDTIDEELCNSKMTRANNGKVYIDSTRELFDNKELLISYGWPYWADRFQLYPEPSGQGYSAFQKNSLNATIFVLSPLEEPCCRTKFEELSYRRTTKLLIY